jgi:ribosomal protein S18 acetylase RimI-like enzyme
VSPAALGDPRWLALDGAVNARAVVRGVLLRSDNLQTLSERDLCVLVEQEAVEVVLDLRTDVEVELEGPGPMTTVSAVRIEHRSLYPSAGHTDVIAGTAQLWGDAHEDEPPGETPVVRVYMSYLRRRPDSIVAAVRAIARTEGAVLVHCAAGKDRTGVVVGLALDAAGVDRAAIAADYLVTGERIEAIIARMCQSPTYRDELAGHDPRRHAPLPATLRGLADGARPPGGRPRAPADALGACAPGTVSGRGLTPVSLDNPIYAALSGPQARFALRHGSALRYAPDVAPFMALPAEPSTADWRDAAVLVPPGTVAGLLHADGVTAPFTPVREFEVVQMVGEDVAGAPDAEAVALGAGDLPEILELVGLTEPGPFLDRTIELGRYIGIRRDGALVAMAGERIRLPGYTEISAVCTLPSHRGQGLAKRLVGDLIAGIAARAERPFLHALTTNTAAIALYEQLGFTTRRHGQVAVLMHETGS